MKEVKAVFHVAPHAVEVREIGAPSLAPCELLIRSHCSAISPGTETLVFSGGVPEDWNWNDNPWAKARDFRYPFKYGYSLVGEVIATGSREDRDCLGQKVFAFHPHQDSVVLPRQDCIFLPAGMPAERALFLANLETALGLVMDAAPLAGERVMVFGQGVVGLLITAILSEFPLDELISADPVADRRERSMQLGAGLAIDPSKGREMAVLADCLFDGESNGMDLIVEVSGRTDALNHAMRLCGFDGRIVVGSWYGRTGGMVNLGGEFHRRRLRLISSQVSNLDPALTGRWTKQRRLKLALDWLDRIQPEKFVTHRFPITACQEAYEMVADKGAGALQVIFEYR